MNKTLLFVVVSVLVVTFVEEHFNRDSSIKIFVSAEPVNNRKDVIRREAAKNMIVNDEDDEGDEIFVRVKRSPDPNPKPRGGRGGGSRGGRSRYVGGGGSSDGMSTGTELGIVFGVLGGVLIFGICYVKCCGKNS